MPPDVLILGAGVAGLSAALDLARAGLHVEIIEGRDRIGGRILTRVDPSLNHPVELGAEFVHGIPPEIWQPLREYGCQLRELEGDFWCSARGELQPCRFFREVEQILGRMDDSSPDESFLDFLARSSSYGDSQDAKQHAIGYVSGFNAADPAQVSVHWLVHGRRAEEQLSGDRAFRIVGGYEVFLNILTAELEKLRIPVRLNTKVREIRVKSGRVEIRVKSAHAGETLTAPRALITFPLGVLQAAANRTSGDCAIRFDPELPSEKLDALEKLAMGKVVRVALCFRKRIWENVSAQGKTLANMTFLFSEDDELFPTWWTQAPDPVPIITGWAPASSAESLAGMNKDRVVNKALVSLASVLGVSISRLQSELAASYFHDWDSDPFSRGAYTYVKIGGEGSQKTLGAPLENKLFFAGEATDISGNNGTVHGAIASGKRAAKEILAAR